MYTACAAGTAGLYLVYFRQSPIYDIYNKNNCMFRILCVCHVSGLHIALSYADFWCHGVWRVSLWHLREDNLICRGHKIHTSHIYEDKEYCTCNMPRVASSLSVTLRDTLFPFFWSDPISLVALTSKANLTRPRMV